MVRLTKFVSQHCVFSYVGTFDSCIPCPHDDVRFTIMSHHEDAHYVFHYNKAKSELHTMSDDDIMRFIQQKLAEVDAARHTLRERTGRIEILPPLNYSALNSKEIAKKVEKRKPKISERLKAIDFDKVLDEMDEEYNE